MGDPQNGSGGSRGFTGMENVMLDLAGGVVASATPGTYGPTTAHMVNYDPSLVGVAQAGSKVYFTPPAKNFKKQDGVEGGTKIAIPLHVTWVPDVIDAEGTPLLMWMADPMAIQPINSTPDFAARNKLFPLQLPSRFYWTSNAAFLSSGASVGEKRVDEFNKSLLTMSNANLLVSMIGVLGNPSSPNNVTNP